METILSIEGIVKERDYYPSLFVNKDQTIVLLADAKTGEKTFSGMVIHSKNESKKGTLGIYSF